MGGTLGWWLAGDADAARAQKRASGWLKRFDPRFWTVDFPRPMMAAVTTTGPQAMRVDLVFYRGADLAGLIWASADMIDHPLLRYATNRDYRGCTLAFRWRSSGLMALDAIDGPTLTIEGRDAGGAAKSWYVRLWNYAVGDPQDARITLDLGDVAGGFLLPGEADPVWAGDVDRMFVSLVPPGYTGGDGELAAPVEAWVEIDGIACDGAGSTLALGDALVPPHGLCIATGYDDAYNVTPARMLRQIVGLGYRGAIDHYVGMSHYFRLEWNAGAGLHLISLAGGVLNVVAAAWHRDFLARAAALGFETILSMSYELLDQHVWNDWKQRGADGVQALTGWDPPSTLLSDGDVSGSGGPALGGYAASGDSLRGAIEGLAAALPVAFADGPDGVTLVDESAAPVAIDAAELGTAAPDKAAPKIMLDRQAAGTLNAAIAISYYDPARDYQIGSQSARRGSSARRAGAIDLAAAVDAATAKGIAEARLAREWAGRTSATLSLPWRRLDLGAGALLALPGQDGVWRVTSRGFEAMLATLTAQRLPGDAPAIPAASAGAGTAQPDLPAGPTTLALLDLPSFGDDLPATPTLLIAAAGASPGWRKAALLASFDAGASWQPIGQTAASAVLGTTLTALPPGSTTLVDSVNGVDVALLADDMALAGSDSTLSSATANLALIGDELVQFAAAEQTAPRVWHLSGLLRGRRGSEWAMAGHGAGERFVLVDADTLLPLALPASAIGAGVRIAASGVGDATPAEASLVFQARALRPPCPVALSAASQADGSLLVGWTRRSRQGWSWLDDIDAPLGEQSELYRLVATRAGGTPLSIDAATPSATLSAAQLAAIAGSGDLALSLVQVGTAAASLPPATLILPSGA